jgi:hypothetical protein
MRQPVCDESGVGFGVSRAEKPTPLWSRHLILRNDETWLPEWCGKLDGVKRCAVRSRGMSWGKPVFRLVDLPNRVAHGVSGGLLDEITLSMG